MITLYAQPYDISANGFYFHNAEEYEEQSTNLRNKYGDLVENFEIQFIDGEAIDCEFANALGLNQVNYKRFLKLIDALEDYEKIQYIIAIGECGYSFDLDDINLTEVDLYHEKSLRDLAIRFVEDGLFGEVPNAFQYYIDYEAIARDLAADYSETSIAGENLIYRCA